MRAPNSSSGPSIGHVLLCLSLLWLAGNGTRITILAVPPVIPLLHTELRMSETEVGILTGLPPVLFALAAVPGSLLIARFGALATLVVGLLATAAGSALRGAVPDIPVLDIALLYGATILTGFGVAVMHPSLPPLVQAWLPDRIGFGTAVYTNGLIVGEILPVALTIPLVLPLVASSWRLGFVAWAVPVVMIALLIAVLAPKPTTPKSDAVTASRRWWPDWKSGQLWRLGLMLGSVNATYFTTNAFIPDYLHYISRSDLISSALTALNVGQIPASLLLLAVASRLERRVWPYVASGVLSILAILGLTFGDGPIIIASAAGVGFCASAILIIVLALPPLLSAPDDVHRMSAGMFTISYSCAVIVPILSGVAWDLTGIPVVAFAPIGAAAVLLIALPQSMDFERRA